MPDRTSQSMGLPAWLADYHSATRDGGHQVDWDNVGEGYRRTPGQTVTASALAAAGATSLSVDALTYAVPSGTVMNFGAVAPVTATVGVAGTAIDATSVPVAALSGAIPSGTVLNFTGAGKFAVLTAAAAAGATSLTVEALDVALVSTNAATYPGGTKIARATADAAAAATSITVDELPLAIEDNDEAVIVGSGAKFLPSGTACGKLLGDGKVSPRIVTTNPAFCLLLTDAAEDSRTDARTGYGVVRGGVIYENLLPEAAGTPPVLVTAVKTELNANGTGFSFEQYGDSSAP
jgi:hypothetical protein